MAMLKKDHLKVKVKEVHYLPIICGNVFLKVISSAHCHCIFHHSVKLHEQSLGTCEEEGGVKAVGRAHGEHLGVKE